MHRTYTLAIAVIAAVSALAGCTPVDGPLGPEKVGQVWTVDESDHPADPALLAKLNQKVPRFEFADVPLKDVLQYIRDWANINIYVNWGALQAAGLDETTPVSVKLKDVPLRIALATVLEDAGGGQVELRHEISEGLLRISTKEDLDTHTVTRIYDIRDVLPPAGKAGPARTANGPCRVCGASGDPPSCACCQPITIFDADGTVSRQRFIDCILALIRTTVDRESWIDEGGALGSVNELSGKLIITQTRENHRQVSRLLSAWREQTPTIPDNLSSGN